MSDNLYEGQSQFKLEFGINTYIIREPYGWDQFELKIGRHVDWHGFVQAIASEDLSLRFDEYSGVEHVREAYNQKHVEAEMYLLFGTWDGVTFTERFRALLDFTEYDDQKNFIEMGLLKNARRQLLLNRKNTKVNVNGSKTLDDLPMNPLSDRTFVMHSKVLDKQSVLRRTKDATVNFTFRQASAISALTSSLTVNVTQYGTLGLDWAEFEELNDVYTYFTPNIEVLPSNLTLLFLYKAKERGAHIINIDLSLDIILIGEVIKEVYQGNPDEGTYDCEDSLLLIEVVLQVGENPEEILASYSETDCNIDTLDTGIFNIITAKAYYMQQNEDMKIFIRAKVSKTLSNFNAIDLIQFGNNLTYTVKENSSVTIVGSTETRYSAAGGLMIYECLDKVIEGILSDPKSFKSNLLGRTDLGYNNNGCVSKYILTNGKKIRGLDSSENNLSLTLDESFNSLDAIFNIGMGMEESDGKIYLTGSTEVPFRLITSTLIPLAESSTLTIYRISEGSEIYVGTLVDISISGSGTLIDPYVYQGSGTDIGPQAETSLVVVVSGLVGKEIVRLEDKDYFYKDVELLFIPASIIDKKSYHKTPIIDMIYNDIVIGYEKYPENVLNTLDEFNTEQQYSTPIKLHRNKFEKKSKFIASGYAIELQRRIQFDNTGNQAAQYDDDTFIIAVTNEEYEADIFRLQETENKIYLKQRIDNLVSIGGTITVYNTDSNNGTYTVVRTETWGALPKKTVIVVAESLVDEFHWGGRIKYSAGEFSPERNQPFETVDNIISPDTAYNLRISPKRMLLNWAKWLNSGWFLKQGTQILKNTFVKNNILSGGLETRFAEGETCLMGDQDRIVVKESEDLMLSEFNGFRKKFKPNKYEFEARLDYETVEKIIEAHSKEFVEEENAYGYIVFQSPITGETISGWIMEMRYNPSIEKVKFVIIEKSE